MSPSRRCVARRRSVYPVDGEATAWAFGPLEVGRIEMGHAVAKSSSGTVAAEAGSAQERRVGAATRYDDGRRYDDHVHVRLASDARERVP